MSKMGLDMPTLRVSRKDSIIDNRGYRLDCASRWAREKPAASPFPHLGNGLALVPADGYSVNRLTRLRLRALQLLDRPQNPLPHRAAVQVASL